MYIASMKIGAIFISSLLSLQASAAIYGSDSRQFTRHRSVAVMIANNMIAPSKASKNLVDLDTDTLENNQYMCSSERFSKVQSFYVSCTGFLIAPDLLMTAGHCAVNFGEVNDKANPYCTDFSWYFDFEADAGGATITKNIPAENIYACEKIMRASHASIPVSDKEIIFKDDFAIVKLKRTVNNRTPIKLSTQRPAVGDAISMVGHPLGGPKIATQGKILADEPAYLRAAISGFEGNSGSPVFNSKGEAFGILVRGYPPGLIDRADNACRVINRCSADASHCTQNDPDGQPAGDHIMPLDLIPELIKLGLIK